MFDCNCQQIILEYLKKLGKLKKNKGFIFQNINKLKKITTEIDYYLINSIINTANVVENFFDISYINNF